MIAVTRPVVRKMIVGGLCPRYGCIELSPPPVYWRSGGNTPENF